MACIFNILGFQPSQDLVEGATKRLNRNGPVAVSKIIEPGDKIVRFADPAMPINALLIQKVDLAPMSAQLEATIESLPSGSESTFIFVGVDLTAEDFSSVVDRKNVVPTQGDVESIRRALIQYYRRWVRREQPFTVFVGRNQELDQFQNLMFSERFDKTKAMIVSGHPGVGREAFVWECIQRVARNGVYEPLTISIGDNGSIELLIVQLNACLHSMTDQELILVLNSDQECKVKMAVDLLNTLFRNKDFLVIYDDSRACLRFNRKLADWFRAIIENPGLQGNMQLYVISTVSVNYTKAQVEDGVAFFTLYDLSFQDRRKLIYSYLSERQFSLRTEDVQFLLDSSVYSPTLLLRLTEDVCNNGPQQVKKRLPDYQSLEDRKIRSIIMPYKEDDKSDIWNLLILLSKIEYISVDILRAVFPNNFSEIKSHLERFITDGIVERFGELSEYYRLDGSIGDFLRRTRQTYIDDSFNGHVEEIMSNLIVNNIRITADYSSYLYKVKKDIEAGKTNQETYLIPSIVLSTIIGTYDNRDWKKTIELCKRTLSQRRLYFGEMIREIRYWYCLALAREQRGDSFYSEVAFFNGDADSHFLKGFYLRIQMQYSRAEDEFRIALKMNPSFYRAKRELVIALQHQHKFSEALELARENYERDSDNAYHLLAYFRCIVRKPRLSYEERNELKRMIDEAKELFVEPYFVDGMEFEYARFVEKQKPEVLLVKTTELSKLNAGKKAPYIEDILGEYGVAQGIDHKIPITRQDDETDE